MARSVSFLAVTPFAILAGLTFVFYSQKYFFAASKVQFLEVVEKQGPETEQKILSKPEPLPNAVPPQCEGPWADVDQMNKSAQAATRAYMNGDWVKVQLGTREAQQEWYQLKDCNLPGPGFVQFPPSRPIYKWVAAEPCVAMNYSSSFILCKLKDSWTTFIGDSLNRNQYDSLLCLLRGEYFVDLVPRNHHNVERMTGFDHVRYFPTYNATVAIAWSTFLVRPTSYTRRARPVHPDPTTNGTALDKVIPHALNYSTHLVLNTGGWWAHRRALFFQSMQRMFGALATFETTHVYFNYEGFSPDCDNPVDPLPKERVSNDPSMQEASNDLDRLHKLFPNIEFLRTVQLSGQRIDAHPGGRDCQHWMLPGVPDLWNRLLFNYVWI